MAEQPTGTPPFLASHSRQGISSFLAAYLEARHFLFFGFPFKAGSLLFAGRGDE